jgi:oligopeptide transport system substrate-binding protein
LKIRRIASLAATVAVGALVLTACSNGGGTGTETTGGSASPTETTAAESSAPSGPTTGIVKANGSEPENPLIPTNTNETGGGKILDLIFAGLVYYGADGAPHNEVADSITSDDNINWTIKLKDGWTFSDGTPVHAENFVDAWNYGALLSHGHLNSYYFDIIDGFSYDEDSELTGLAVVDDLTFTVKLTSALSDFPLRLGYSAFYPLPESAFDDIDAFGENPIGNGPYKVDTWTHNQDITLVPNPEYKGERVPQNGGVDLIFYTSLDSAYADLQGGNLDVLDSVPSSAFASFESDLGDRAVNQPAAIFQSFTIPEKGVPHFESGEEGNLRRAAISEAIDRDAITKTIFSGTRTPATDFTSPVIDGWSDSVPGNEVLKYNPDDAKAKWAQADAISPWSGTFTIGYNADGGHQEWVDAVINSVKNVLGIDAAGQSYPDFKSIRKDVNALKTGDPSGLTGGFRTGWQADYPGLYNFLAPLYATDAGSNDGLYSNPQVDDLLKKGAEAKSTDEANADFQQAQSILFQDLPAVPLWYSNVTGGSAETVGNVEFGWNSVPLYYEITKAE